MLEHKTHLNVRLSYAKVCSCDNKKRYYFTVVSHHDVMIIVNHLLKQVGRMVIRIFFCSFSFCFFVCLFVKKKTKRLSLKHCLCYGQSCNIYPTFGLLPFLFLSFRSIFLLLPFSFNITKIVYVVHVQQNPQTTKMRA